jgi:hypothetical protein
MIVQAIVNNPLDEKINSLTHLDQSFILCIRPYNHLTPKHEQVSNALSSTLMEHTGLSFDDDERQWSSWTQ